MNELFQQVRVLDPVSGVDRVADVLVVDGVIRDIADGIIEVPPDTQRRNGQGWVLGPGLVDLYSHSGEPGFEDRETLDSLMQAAAAGGFTRLALLPDTDPPIDRPSLLSWMGDRTRTVPSPHLYFWGALTQGVEGQHMSELAELAAAGVVGFADGQPLQNRMLVRRLLEYAQPLDKPIALWACDRQLVGDGVVRDGVESLRFGLSGNPDLSETTALAAILECIAGTKTPVHLMRVSTARSVELIQGAKARGLPITASTTWMHLLLDTTALGSYDPNLRLEPPLGNPSDRQALIEGVQTGILDAIAIDHTPYTYEEKTVAFAKAPPGAIGLELALPLLWQGLVVEGNWSALELWNALSTQPAICLGQTPARIAIDRPAELTLFDPEKMWVANRKTLKSLSENTPWLAQEIRGQVISVNSEQ